MLDDVAVIKLHKGVYAICDMADYFELSKRSWHLDDQGYARGSFRDRDSGPGYKTKRIRMHRHLLGLGKGVSGGNDQGDHKNRNRLDNRRANLRVATSHENLTNRGDKFADYTNL